MSLRDVSIVFSTNLPIQQMLWRGFLLTGKDDGFDADVAIATGELRKLLPELLEALGGEVEAA